MAKRVPRAEGRLVVALAALSIVCCLRISEAASIRSIEEAFVRFYDFKCKDNWVGSLGSCDYKWRYMEGKWPYRSSKVVQGNWVKPWQHFSKIPSSGTSGGIAGTSGCHDVHGS